MPSLEMMGPYELTLKAVDREVKRPGPGNYAVGHLNQNGMFVVRRIGRSDGNLKDDIKLWIGKYKRFKYSTTVDLDAAFLKHCRNFHDFMAKLDDQTHPTPRAGSTAVCPVCSQAEAAPKE